LVNRQRERVRNCGAVLRGGPAGVARLIHRPTSPATPRVARCPRRSRAAANPALVHGNAARLGFFGLWQDEGHNAVFQFGSDAVLIDLARELKAARVVADTVLDV
jgi:hypothetical protein